MIYLYSKIYNNTNKSYIYAGNSVYSVIKDEIKITEQPTLEAAIGYRNVLFTNKAVNWLTETFGEAVDSTELFYTLTGYLFPTDTASLIEATQIGYKKCRNAKVLIYFDEFEDGNRDEFHNFALEFLKYNNKENIFIYSELRESEELQNKLKDILAMEKDLSLEVLNHSLNMNIGEIDTIGIKSSVPFKIEISKDNQVLPYPNDYLTITPQMDSYPSTTQEVQFEGLKEGLVNVKISAKNAFMEKSVDWDLFIADPNNVQQGGYTKSEVDTKLQELETKITSLIDTKLEELEIRLQEGIDRDEIKIEQLIASIDNLKARVKKLEGGVAP